MAKKVVKEESARPAYLNADGTLEISKIFKHQPKQTELLEMRTVQGAPYVRAWLHSASVSAVFVQEKRLACSCIWL